MLDHFIDIYSKLLISIISFVVPLTTYILSTFLEGRSKILLKLTEQKKEIDKILANDLQNANNQGVNARQFLEDVMRRMKEMDTTVQKKKELLEFLNPKVRILYLFAPLFLSLLLLIFDVIVRDNLFGWYSHLLSVCLISSSCLFFILTMCFLIHVAYKLIDAKQMLEDEKKEFIREQVSKPVEQVKEN